MDELRLLNRVGFTNLCVQYERLTFFFCFTGIWRHHGEEDWAGAHHWHLRRTDDSRAVQPGGGEARRLLD